MIVENNESAHLCGICGGECCRTKPGIESPERILGTPDPAAALAGLLASGKWVLDRHYGIGDTGVVLYPRPATVEEHRRHLLLAAEGGGECVFLGDDRCALSFDERPLMCRALEPDPHFECESSWTRPDAARSWLPHAATVEKAVRLLGHTLPRLVPPWEKST